MEKCYIIYNLESKSYYTGIKNYEWSESVWKVKAFKAKPTIKYMSRFKNESNWLEVKAIYKPNK